jgi:hypothetical protein
MFWLWLWLALTDCIMFTNHITMARGATLRYSRENSQQQYFSR